MGHSQQPSPSPRLGTLIGQRGRDLLSASAWSAVAKGCAATNAFATIPFAVEALSPAQFGVWATLVSLATFAGFLDFGISNGTMNLIAGAAGRGRLDEASAIFRISASLLLRLCLAGGVALTIGLLAVDWWRVMGLEESASEATHQAFAILFATVVASVFLNLGYKVLLGLGLASQTYRWQAAGQLLALVSVILAALNGVGLAGLVAAALATPLLAAAGCLLSVRRRLPTPAIRARVDRLLVRRTITIEGGHFFLMQLATALAFWADAMIVASTSGPETAGTYAVLQRVFSVIPLILGLLWGPLWPLYRRMMSAGNLDWAKRIQRKMLIVATAYSIGAAAVFAVMLQLILEVLGLGDTLVPSVLIAGFAIWAVLESTVTSVVTFLNSASLIRIQIPFALVFAVGALITKIVVANSGHSELMPLVTCAWCVAVCVLPYAIFRHRIMASIEPARL